MHHAFSIRFEGSPLALISDTYISASFVCSALFLCLVHGTHRKTEDETKTRKLREENEERSAKHKPHAEIHASILVGYAHGYNKRKNLEHNGQIDHAAVHSYWCRGFNFYACKFQTCIFRPVLSIHIIETQRMFGVPCAPGSRGSIAPPLEPKWL